MDDKALFPNNLRQLGADRLARLLNKVCLASPAAAEVVRTSLKVSPPPQTPGRDAPVDGMVWRSDAMADVVEKAETFAASDLPILITGETGVGKDLLARVIHESSPVGRGPFIAVNCASFTAGLIGSELFGHERGAFTGAQRCHHGYVEQAAGGTLFLDEIGELPAEQQGHLLRLAEQGTYYRVGGEAEQTATIRIIAATNAPLETMIEQKTFRLDLYYRLNVLGIKIPPLRERAEDIAPLVEYFAGQCGLTDAGPALSPDLLRALAGYPWPGNVREVATRTRRAVLIAQGQPLRFEDFGLPTTVVGGGAVRRPTAPRGDGDVAVAAEANQAEQTSGRSRKQKVTEHDIRKTLFTTNYNISKSARILGVSRLTVYKWIKRYNIQDGRYHG